MCTYFVYVYVQNENSIYLPAFVLVKKYNSQYLLQKNLCWFLSLPVTGRAETITLSVVKQFYLFSYFFPQPCRGNVQCSPRLKRERTY